MQEKLLNLWEMKRVDVKYHKYIRIAFTGSCLYLLRNLFWYFYNKIKSYPNGPLGLPLFGCFFHFGLRPRKFLLNIAIQYGPICFAPIMASNNLYISDPKMIKKLFQSEKIVDRPSFALKVMINNKPTKAFPMVNGKEWEKRRKYAMETVFTLSNTSFTLRNMKYCLDKYIEPIMNSQYINSNKNNHLWYPKEFMHFFAFNNTFSTTFDQTLPFNDPFITKYCTAAKKAEKSARFVILTGVMSNGRDIIPEFIKWHLQYKQSKICIDSVIDWMKQNGFVIDFENNILKRKQTNELKQKQMNKANVYIDFLIQKLQNNEISMTTLFADIFVILAVSIDSTAISLEYGFLLLAKYPNIQQMVYDELMDVIKKHNLKEFNFGILSELHIFRAFIHEILRISCAVPTGIPHATSKDHKLNINGKNVVIPKSTICHVNTYYIQKYLDWNTGKSFDKENNEIHLEYWLENKKFKMNENFVLFGYGKRDCVGRSMAMKSIYAVFGLMITKYKFIAPNNDPHQMEIKQSWGLALNVYPSVGLILQHRMMLK